MIVLTSTKPGVRPAKLDDRLIGDLALRYAGNDSTPGGIQAAVDFIGKVRKLEVGESLPLPHYPKYAFKRVADEN